MQLTRLDYIPKNITFQEGDFFVLFGELFGKGYANGLVQQAREHRMKIIGITVGRRDVNKNLRPLTSEELKESEQNLGGEIINIPLEAGFDLEEVNGKSPVNIIDAIDKNNWKSTVDEDHILKCKEQSEQKFLDKLRQVVAILAEKIPADKNIFFAHIMAGGVPRSKLFFVLANRVFKGTKARYQSSMEFWNSGIGKICDENFNSVTADTFFHLIEETKKILTRNKRQGKKVFYSAYGYHGTEIYLQGKFQWQTYIPYQQGHAKKKLEDYARKFASENIQTTVFNCPEILTNSSSIFLGVELPLFSLLRNLKQLYPSNWTNQIWQQCQDLLKDEIFLKDIVLDLEKVMLTDLMQKSFNFEKWPVENTAETSDLIISKSENIRTLYKDVKNSIPNLLSKLIIEASGKLIFNYASEPKKPVIWLGHDIIANKLSEIYINK